MKKRIIFTIWMALALVLTITRPVSADVIPPPEFYLDNHQVDLRVRFGHLNYFPDIVLIARYPHATYAKGPPGPIYYTTYQIEDYTNLPPGDRGSADIYWNFRESANIVDPNKFIMTVNLFSQYLKNSNPLIQETYEYTVAGFYGDKLVVYESTHYMVYNDGTPAKIETYPAPFPIASPHPESKYAANVSANQTSVITPPAVTIPADTPTVPSMAEIHLTDTDKENPPPQNPLPPPSLSYEQKFLLALLLTLAVEIPVALLLVRFVFKRQDISLPKIALVGLVASGLTLPYLWFILPSSISNSILYLIIGEISVFLVETLIYIWLLKLKFGQALAVSLIANAASMLIGFVVL